MPISTPDQITVPFATSGLKNAIPAASNPVTGNAGYDAGFPATNMTPKEAGGIPPFGQDFNGILFDITTAIQYLEAGMQFPYSSSFATAVGGYPLGAIVTRTDGAGFWRNTVANNTTNPETFGAGWQPEGAGISAVAMSNANVTLTALQAAQPIILITGTLTANLNLILPAYTKQWAVVNSATGASFGVTVKTAAGSGYQVMTGASATVVGDGTDIRGTVLATSQATESVVGVAKIATSDLALAGTDNATIMTPAKTKAVIVQAAPGAATESVAGIAKVATQAITNDGTDDLTLVTPKKLASWATTSLLGIGQTWQDVTASRAGGTNYVNSTGKPIAVSCYTGDAGTQILRLLVNGITVSSVKGGVGVRVCAFGIVPPYATYSVTVDGTAIEKWMELR